MANITEIQVPQGSDKRIQFTYKNAAGVAIDLSTFAGYGWFMLNQKNEIIFKWSKNSLSGYGDIVETNAAQGQGYFEFTRDQNKALAEGYYHLEFKVQTTDGGDPWFPDTAIRKNIIHILASGTNGIDVLA